jgi:Ca2+-transporting ATPase
MTHTGLTSQKAQTLLTKHGPNELHETDGHAPVTIFIAQFNSALVWLLLAATVLSFALGDPLDGILIFLIVILNAILGFVQEFKAERALAALKRMTVSTVRVVRDGTVVELDGKLLVPGDIILLEEGDKVPADARVVESLHMEVNEASFTGESLPVEKNTKKEHEVFMGTIVARGRATAMVMATGMHTKFGAIAAKLGEMRDEETPLEKKMGGLGKQLGVIALSAAGVIFGAGFLRHDPLFESVITAISLAVAAVPEGLPAVVTITLAIGTQRMARQRSILRKLAAIESLGSVTVIATDKTGTITKNDMRVTDVWTDGTSLKPAELVQEKSPHTSELLRIGVLCNNATLADFKEGAEPHVVGDKTEGSLLLLARQVYPEFANFRAEGDLVEEFAFHPTPKMMTVIWKKGHETEALTKGAPEFVLAKCAFVLTKTGIKPLTQERRQEIEKALRTYASRGLRLIAFAKKTITWAKQTREQVESKLTFVGFVGIADPPREEVADAVAIAQKAGIQTLMITGDNELTAAAIAEQVGLISHGAEVITGVEFAKLTDEEAKVTLARVRVFARTTPEEKLRIVRLLQQLGHVVAVTGDGVNDALALKQADVGVAMGIMGTDVAKEASDMIITDDNYASLVLAVEEGRTIFDNIKSATKYLIGCNFGEILAITGGVILGWPFILTPLHILYVNLVTDGLPAVGLALTPKQGDIMGRRPRVQKTIFGKHDVAWFVEVGVLTGFATLASFIVGWIYADVTVARSLAFTALILAQQYIFYDIASRNHSFFKLSPRRFPWLLIPLAIMVAQVFILITPLLHTIFKISMPPAALLAISIAITSILFVVSELRKKYASHLYSHH